MFGGSEAKIMGSGANSRGFRVKVWGSEAKIWCPGNYIRGSRAKSLGP